MLVEATDKYERFMRQLDILNPDVCNVPIHVIGAGATGSFVTLSLAKMGFENIIVYDQDSVEDHNFPNQLFPLNCLGKNKASALKEIVNSFTGVDINCVEEFYKDQPLEGIVISAVDSMKARKMILERCKKSPVELLIDPRCGAEVVHMLTIDMTVTPDIEYYEKSLFKDEDADPVPCTARAIIYSVLIVSAYIAKQVKLFQMKQEYKRELIIDLKNDILQKM